MGKMFLLPLLCFFVIQVPAQNLLANGDFEDVNICIEFRSGCAPEAWFRIPGLPLMLSKAAGNKSTSIVMDNVFDPAAYRTYIYTKLLCTPVAGRQYRFKAWFRTNENIFDHADVMLLAFEPARNRKLLPKEKQKFTITPNNKVQVHPGEWTEYSIEFTALGNERYLVLGNFAKETMVPHGELRNEAGNINYDIDNVSLLPVDSSIAICPEWKTNKIVLYQNNSRHTPNNFLDDEEPVTIATPEPAPVPVLPVVNDTLIIPDVLFRLNNAELNPAFTKRLDSLIDKIKTKTFSSISVVGHTDSLGTTATNQALSMHRAESVKNYLVSKLQYPAASIRTSGMAATIPVSSNKTSAGRQKNRRVEIILVR